MTKVKCDSKLRDMYGGYRGKTEKVKKGYRQCGYLPQPPTSPYVHTCVYTLYMTKESCDLKLRAMVKTPPTIVMVTPTVVRTHHE